MLANMLELGQSSKIMELSNSIILEDTTLQKKKLNAIITTISKKHPNLLIFINLSLYKQKMLSF